MPAKYLGEAVLANLVAGARKSVRGRRSVDLASETACSVSKDRAEAYRRAHFQVGIYIAAEMSRPVAEQMGLGEERSPASDRTCDVVVSIVYAQLPALTRRVSVDPWRA